MAHFMSNTKKTDLETNVDMKTYAILSKKTGWTFLPD